MKIRTCVLIVATVLLALLASSVQAEVEGNALSYQHNGEKLQGYLAYDPSQSGTRPGVLLVHEWWGHNDYVQERARQYAALGYVAFALDMYGVGVVTTDPNQASQLSKRFYEDRDLFRARVAAGLAQLTAQKQVDATRVAVLGYCFGGTGALELARSGAPIRAAISFHGGLGSPKPAVKGAVRGKILVLNGAEDPMVKPEERSGFMDEMRAAGADWQFVEFGGAVHAFSNKKADSFNIPGVAYHAAADTRSFEMSRDFLVEAFS